MLRTRLRGMKTHAPTSDHNDPEYRRWLDGIAPLAEGAKLRGCSTDTLIREYQRGRIELIRRTTRLWGIRRRVALAIPKD
jgi:hypothetical protein